MYDEDKNKSEEDKLDIYENAGPLTERAGG